MLRPALALLLAVVLVGPASGAPRPRPHRLLMVGDSVGHGTLAPLRRALSHRRVSASVVDGMSLTYGVRLLARRRLHLPPVVLAELGSNQDPRILPPIRRMIGRAIRLVGPRRCLVWPTVYDHHFRELNWAKFNRMLKQEHRRHQNFWVFDWARYADAHRALIGPDELHPTARGYEVRARLLAGLLRRRCHL